MNLPPEVREKRLNDALDTLVKALVPVQQIEDENTRREIRGAALELAQTLLKSPVLPAVVSDVNHASDLIKKKLIRTNSSPEKALRFSNLYSRLLTLPGINQKWAVLYFLYQLSDSDVIGYTEPRPKESTRKVASGGSLSPNASAVYRSDQVFSEAFASNGLQQLPRQGTSRDKREPDKSRPPTSAARETHVDRTTRAKETEHEPVHSSSQRTPAELRDQVALKTVLLAENYLEINPPETALLRDLPYSLQGLSSTYFTFVTAQSIKLPSTLPPPIISILHTLSEPSLLYRSLTAFVESEQNGLLYQSLRSAISQELRSYLTLIATLEAQIRKALSSLDESQPRGGIGKAGVTLKRCVVWTREAAMGLRLMSLIAEESKCKKGGQLISLIHGFSSSHGDPMVGSFAERLLSHVTRPFYDMLRHWIYDGELSDPHLEFFVSQQDPNVVQAAQDSRGRGGATSVWEDKYKLKEDMIPSIVTPEFAKKVFLIGKSLNFIRYGCGDSIWVDNYSKAASKELRYGDTATLEAWIDEAYKTTMARLIHLMTENFNLFEHLNALKKYILLGQGDFIALLMESLSTDLDRPAGAQYRHTLTAQLEHAIRGSNAQYDSPEVLRRLDARMLTASHGDIGWDCFTLEYKIDAPVDVVVTDWGNRQYLKVFNFLWRIKRVEFVLQQTWRKCMTGARGVLQSVDDTVAQAWKSTRGVLAEMIHFIGQLQFYILFEVIESSWDELQTAIHKEGCTLDDLISAHTKYLTAITHKGLLGAKKRSKGDEDNTFMAQLSEILRIMLSYRDAVDGLYSWSVAEFSRRQEASVRAETRLGVREDDDDLMSAPGTARRGPKLLDDLLNSTPGAALGSDPDEDQMFPALQDRLKGLGVQYRSKLNVLLGDLIYQPDHDVRYLGVVMNFNDVYQPVRRPRTRK